MRAPARALAERGWGAFYERAEGGAAGSEIQPYLGDAEGTCGPRGLDPYREVGGPGGPRRRVTAGDAGLGDPAFRVTLRVGGAL